MKHTVKLGKEKYSVDTKPLNDLGFLTTSYKENYISFAKFDKDKKGEFSTFIFIRKDKKWYYNSMYEVIHERSISKYIRGLTIEETEAVLAVLKSLEKV